MNSEPLHELLAAMAAMRDGDFSVQLPSHWDGIAGRLAVAFNEIASHNRRFCHDLARVGAKVGRDGQTRQRIAPANRQGAWVAMEQSVNDLIDDLVRPVETMTEAMAGVAKGDLTRTVPLEADGRPLQGEFLRSATIVNRMLEQMGEFSSEVTRVALEVGTANTELAERNVQLQLQIGERQLAETRLLRLDRRKDEFLATLAHELRNPLASLSNAMNVLQLSAQEDGSQPLYATMERQLGLLVHLIDDLLDVARISQDKLTLRPIATTLALVLDAAIESVAPLMDATGHTLQLKLPPQPVPMHGDPARLSQVFSNLLSNAAKYSDAGTAIVLGARVDGVRVVVSVEDRGIGLTPEQAVEIFEPFAQIDTAVERARGGLGIGLTLVRRLVGMHGGEVVAHSDGLGRGCRFDVTLPLVAAHPDISPAPPGAPVVASEGAPRRALVIDDNRDSADTLAMMLELLGHETRRLYDPRAAVATVEAFAPDVVFLDIGMPGLSGYDVARLLRASPAGHRLMLVAVTGWGQPDDRRRTGEAGFDHHLVKPPEMAAIRRICDELSPRSWSAA